MRASLSQMCILRTFVGGKYVVVKSLHIDEFARGKLVATETELLEERALALPDYK